MAAGAAFGGSDSQAGGMEAITLEAGGALFRHEPGMEGAARMAADAYPAVKEDLERTFGWRVDFTPTIDLMREGLALAMERSGGESDPADRLPIAAVAISGENRIIIDMSRVGGASQSLSATLKHELCHLLLHRNIPEDRLPKWLDEGLCQWVSEGFVEILARATASDFRRAALGGDLYRLSELTRSFPRHRDGMALAYEQSRRVVVFLQNTYGEAALMDLLRRLARGEDVDAAFGAALSVSPAELEREWKKSLQSEITWFGYLAMHLYEILFFLAAVATTVGFFRRLRKKRQYRDEEDE